MIYAIVRHHPSGEPYAIRADDYGNITGLCGPLYYEDLDLPVDGYDFDDADPDDLIWANSIGTDINPTESLVHVRDIDVMS